jgi:hypothetical protein
MRWLKNKMKKLIAASLLMMLMTTYVAAQPAPTCVTFDACVDGSDWVTVDDGQMMIEHRNYNPIGAPGDCPEAWWNILKIEGVSHTVSLQPSDTYLIDGAAALSMPIEDLEIFTKTSGRGTVSWSGTHTILIDDDGYGGGTTYSIELCGTPTTTTTTLVSVPEFGSAAAALAVLLTSTGFAYLAAKKRK